MDGLINGRTLVVVKSLFATEKMIHSIYHLPEVHQCHISFVKVDEAEGWLWIMILIL